MGIQNFERAQRRVLALFCTITIAGLWGCGSSESIVECPEAEAGAEWVRVGTVCSLRRDGFNWGVASIAAALDGSDDLYVLGSFTHYYNSSVEPVVRLNNDGSLDTGFKSRTELFAPLTVVPATDGSGDVYVGGLLDFDGSTHRGITRLNLDGSKDAGFDTGTGIGWEVRSIVLADDGSGDVYVGGMSITPPGAAYENGPIRLNSDGSRDADFNPASNFGDDALALATDGSGDIYVSVAIAPRISRLNDDGSVDGGFNPAVPGFNRSITDIAVANDGSGDVYVAGFFTEFNGEQRNGLARLNSDGSLDTGFVVATQDFLGGRFVVPVPDGSGDVYAHSSNTQRQNILRLNSDGTVDTAFGPGSTGVNVGGTLGEVVVAADGSGDIFVAGDFTSYNSEPAVMLLRLDSQGELIN